ncbi:hypothetical protein HYY74_00380 [Candidatus Woesearchaeota archaeon]|nr:hypothetical protein [Candidatus Woesearchaeota archaeon]
MIGTNSDTLFVFDDSIIGELKRTRDNFKQIIDYLTFQNSVGTITIGCWKKIEESSLPPQAINLLRGHLSDIRHFNGTGEIVDEVIKLCNYESQLKEVILVSQKEYPQNCFSGALKPKSFLELAGDIQRDKEFFFWRSLELWKIQKFKGKNSE